MCSPCTKIDNYDLMENQIEIMKHWECSLPFNESLTNELPKYVDLCKMFTIEEAYMFPIRFTGESSKEKLIQELKIAAMKAGFALMLRTTSRRKSRFYDQTCHLYCQHGVPFRHRNKQNVRVAKSKWCVGASEKCNFRVIIGLLRDSGRWVFKNFNWEKQTTCDVHTGHFKLDISHIHTGIALLSSSEIELSRNCSQLNISYSSTTELLNLRNFLGFDNKWKTSQVYYKLNQCGKLNTNASSAQQLISTFDNRNDVNYLYVTYAASEGLILFTGN